jgi:predicted Fe-Mo cluster-binding NifX family protein
VEYTIAVTTSAGEIVDLHFGQADSFSIYTIDIESGKYTFSEKRIITKTDFSECEVSLPNPGYRVCNGTRAEFIGELLSDCVYLLTAKIGEHPHRTLLRKGISALETPYPLEHAIEKLNNYHRKTAKGKRGV